MNPLLPAERLLQEVTARYGSAQAFFEVLDLLRADPNVDTIELLPLPDILYPEDLFPNGLIE